MKQIALYIFLISALTYAHPRTVNQENKEMCASGKTEGSYIVDFTETRKIRINIICTSPEAMIATMRDLNGDGIFYSLIFSTIDGVNYSFTSYGTGRNDAGYIGTNTLCLHLKLNLADLREGRLNGTFMAANGWQRIPIKGTRAIAFQRLPTWDSNSRISLQEGLYVPQKEDTPVRVLDIEIIGGIQRIIAKFDIGRAMKMLNGADATSLNGGFYATSSYSRGEDGRTAIGHVRGRMIKENEIEFYYVNMEQGLLGPFLAKRQQSLNIK